MRIRPIIGFVLCFLCHPLTGAAGPAASSAAGSESSYFGIFNLPIARAHDWPFTATRAGPGDLTLIENSGLTALVALTGSKRNYSDLFGCFQLSQWKETLDRQDSARIQRLIDRGIIVGLYAIDEPHDWACGPSFDDIDAACAYAIQKWPALKCGVNAPPGWLKPGSAKLSHLGFLFFQYSSRMGSPAEWLNRQLSDADWFHGDIWLSIQLLQPRLSVDEARKAALAFCRARPAGVLMWKWSDEWFAQTGAAEAMREVASACGMPRPPGAASSRKRAR